MAVISCSTVVSCYQCTNPDILIMESVNCGTCHLINLRFVWWQRCMYMRRQTTRCKRATSWLQNL